MWETCFEKSRVLDDFINELVNQGIGKNGFYYQGGPLNERIELFKRGIDTMEDTRGDWAIAL